MISALFTVLLVLLAGLVNSGTPKPYSGLPPAVFTTPSKPPASSTIKVMVAALPKDASRVKIVTDEGTYPTRRSGVREFTAKAVPTPIVPGPWELDLQFNVRGTTFTTIGSVVMVTQHR